MVRNAERLLLVAVLAGLTCPGAESGRAQELLPAPTPVPGTGFAPVPRLQLPPAPASPAQPAPGPAPVFTHDTFADVNGLLLHGDAAFDPPGWRQGWFAGVEVGILVPHIKNHLSDTVVFTPTVTDTVTVPITPLSWTASPRVELGYRFDEGCSEIRLAYQSLVSDGTGTLPDFDFFGDGRLTSRVNVNLLDLDYAAEKFGLGNWLCLRNEFQWSVGVRLASVFFDTRAQGQVLEQRVSSNFFGAGPHACLDAYQALPLANVGIFARVQGAVAIGSTRQSFEEAFVFSNGAFGAAATERLTQAVPMLDVQAGLSWAPCWSKHGAHFTAGYQLQNWWYVGQTRGGSDASLTAQGVFLRGELGF